MLVSLAQPRTHTTQLALKMTENSLVTVAVHPSQRKWLDLRLRWERFKIFWSKDRIQLWVWLPLKPKLSSFLTWPNNIVTKDERMKNLMQIRVGSCVWKVAVSYITSLGRTKQLSAEVAVPERRKTFCLEGSKRILCPDTHASHGVICDRNKRATKLILWNRFL